VFSDRAAQGYDNAALRSSRYTVALQASGAMENGPLGVTRNCHRQDH
jgi:hypothetical protein